MIIAAGLVLVSLLVTELLFKKKNIKYNIINTVLLVVFTSLVYNYREVDLFSNYPLGFKTFLAVNILSACLLIRSSFDIGKVINNVFIYRLLYFSFLITLANSYVVYMFMATALVVYELTTRTESAKNNISSKLYTLITFYIMYVFLNNIYAVESIYKECFLYIIFVSTLIIDTYKISIFRIFALFMISMCLYVLFDGAVIFYLSSALLIIVVLIKMNSEAKLGLKLSRYKLVNNIIIKAKIRRELGENIFVTNRKTITKNKKHEDTSSLQIRYNNDLRENLFIWLFVFCVIAILLLVRSN